MHKWCKLSTFNLILMTFKLKEVQKQITFKCKLKFIFYLEFCHHQKRKFNPSTEFKALLKNPRTKFNWVKNQLKKLC